MRIYRVLILWLLTGLLFSTLLGAAALKIGSVDLQLVLNSVDEGKKAKQLLESEYEKKKIAIQDKEQELKLLQDMVYKSDGILSESARQEKEKEFKEKFVAYQKLAQEYHQDMQQKEVSYTNTILNEIRKFVSDFGVKNNYTYILEKSAVIYAIPAMDVTNEIIKIYNQHKLAKQKKS